MMKIKLILTLFAFLLLINLAYAFDASKVNYPVAELGNCASQDECAVYCDNPDNMEFCIDYGYKNGMISQQEYDEAKKALPFMKRGETPGNCKGQKECDAYCNDDSHLNECIDFAVKAGFIDAKEAEIVKKTGGKGPGGCKKEECDAYCEKEENFPTCLEFAHENGMINDEEYQMAKKTGGKGPGGCKGKEECDALCKANELECIKWGMEKGLNEDMSEESKCMMECMIRLNVVCKPSNGPEEGACGECGKECSQFYTGPCLKQEDYTKKMEECDAQGMNINPIKGESGDPNRGECDVAIECVAREMPENYSEEKSCEDCVSKCEGREGQQVTGTDCINNQCACFYAPVEVPKEEPGQESGDSGGGGSGGCTQPGPEGQCNPGPGAGSEGGGTGEPGSGDGTPGGVGDGSGGVGSGGSYEPGSDSGGSVDSGSSGGGESSGDSGDSGGSSGGDSGGSSGGEGGVTGSVIAEGVNNLIQEIIDFLKNIPSN